jgi:hypothetical protein
LKVGRYFASMAVLLIYVEKSGPTSNTSILHHRFKRFHCVSIFNNHFMISYICAVLVLSRSQKIFNMIRENTDWLGFRLPE